MVDTQRALNRQFFDAGSLIEIFDRDYVSFLTGPALNSYMPSQGYLKQLFVLFLHLGATESINALHL